MKIERLLSLSIIITAFNEVELLKECLRSVVTELEGIRECVEAYEIIVVDDGSKDPLEKSLGQFKDQIKLVRTPQNLGRASAKNFGLEAAQYQIISFIDSDDLCAPGRFYSFLQPFLENPMLECVIGRTCLLNSYRELPELSQIIEGVLPGSLAISRKGIEKVGEFTSTKRTCDFAEWYSRFIDVNLTTQLVNEVVLLRRIHSGNSSLAESEEYWGELFRVLRGRLKESKEEVKNLIIAAR